MVSLSEFIQEASINAKKRNVSFAKKMFTKGGKNGGIGAFAIITAENPDSVATDRKTNTRLLDTLKKEFKRDGYVWVTVEGHYSGNKENSILVFNIKKDVAMRYAGRYEQTSFFYCTAGEKTPMCEYYEKTDKDAPYDEKKNPYRFINKTDIIHDAKGAKDNYTIIGGDYKFNIDDSVFERVNEALVNAAKNIMESSDGQYAGMDDVFEWATNRVGQKSLALRTKMYGYMESALESDNI